MGSPKVTWRLTPEGAYLTSWVRALSGGVFRGRVYPYPYALKGEYRAALEKWVTEGTVELVSDLVYPSSEDAKNGVETALKELPLDPDGVLVKETESG